MKQTLKVLSVLHRRIPGYTPTVGLPWVVGVSFGEYRWESKSSFTGKVGILRPITLGLVRMLDTVKESPLGSLLDLVSPLFVLSSPQYSCTTSLFGVPPFLQIPSIESHD